VEAEIGYRELLQETLAKQLKVEGDMRYMVLYGDIISLLLILFSIQFPQVPHFLTADHQTVNLIVFPTLFAM